MNTTTTPTTAAAPGQAGNIANDRTRVSCLIFRPSPFGRMYLCADGTTSNNRNDAACFWLSQVADVIRENWIVNTPEPAQVEILRPSPCAG